MDKRKKLLKLFSEIEQFCVDSGLKIDPRTYLLNKLYLHRVSKRVSGALLRGIDRERYSLINRKFDDRLKSSFLVHVSMTDITTLPHKKVISVPPSSVSGEDMYLLSPTMVLDVQTEAENNVHIAYIPSSDAVISPFPNLIFAHIDRNQPMEISFQSTLFDVINTTGSTVRPHSFHRVLDEIIYSPVQNQDVWFDNVEQLLNSDGFCSLFVKSSFLSSPATKQLKRTMYERFHVDKLEIFDKFAQIYLHRKPPAVLTSATLITNHKQGTTIELSPTDLRFNPMLTFDETLSKDDLRLVRKIDEQATGRCKDFLKFFLGMFTKTGVKPQFSAFKSSGGYKPLVRSKQVLPYARPIVREYVVPSAEFFFQIPDKELFESRKLLLRYLSVRPVAMYDDRALYFLKDIAALIIRDDRMRNETGYAFVEGYLNSTLLHFYYHLMFPHHNKFLKKNFNKLPFFLPPESIQRLIADLVIGLRSIYSRLASRRTEEDEKRARELKRKIDRSVYRLFHLTQDEIALVENEVSRR